MARPDFEKIQAIQTPDILKGKAVVQNPSGLVGSKPVSTPSAWSSAWSPANAMSTGMGVIQGVTGIASAIGKNYQIKDTESLDEQIDALRNTEFGYGDFDSLQSAYNPVTIDKVTGDDLRSSDGERFSNTLSAVGSGLSAGAAFGPVGMAIGAGVGLLGSIGGMWAGNAKAGKEASRLNKEAEAAQKEYLANFSNNAQNIAQSNFNRAALNLAAFGGMLKDNNINSFLKSRVRLAAFGGDMMSPMGRTDGFSNGVTKVDEGGTHESNPFDGVMMGVDPQGTPNLVEEGEVIFNDYVFSNRLSPTEEELESVKLPRKYAKKPYSKIAWDIQRESRENPLDKISKNTLVDSMMKLTTLQEQSRERDREYEAFSNLESVFADGGNIHIKPSKRGTFTAAAKRHGMGVQEFASKVLANKDKYSPAMVKKANFAHNAAGWKHGFGGNLYPFGGPTEKQIFTDWTNAIIAEGNKRNNGISQNGIRYEEPLVPEYPEADIALAIAQPGSVVTKAMAPAAYRGMISGLASGEGSQALIYGLIPESGEWAAISKRAANVAEGNANKYSHYMAVGKGESLPRHIASNKKALVAKGVTPEGEPYVIRENSFAPSSTGFAKWPEEYIGPADWSMSGSGSRVVRGHALGGPMGNMFVAPVTSSNYIIRPSGVLFDRPSVGYVPKDTTLIGVPQIAAPQTTWMPFMGKPEERQLDFTPDKNLFPNGVPETNKAEAKKSDSDIPEFQNSWANTAMRAVPVIGSSINAMADAFGWRNKEDYSALDLIKQRENQIRNVKTSPIGRYMAFNPYDVDYEVNRLQNVGLGTQRALLDSAGGNPLAARNAALALNANLTSQMGAARRAGAQYNDELRRAVTQFNSGIDQFNAQQALQAGAYNQRGDVERMEGAIRRAALMDAIQTANSQARSTEETAALNNWGQWGNDRTFADMAAWYQRYIAPYNDATRAYGQARADKGGKIKRIKEFKKK